MDGNRNSGAGFFAAALGLVAAVVAGPEILAAGLVVGAVALVAAPGQAVEDRPERDAQEDSGERAARREAREREARERAARERAARREAREREARESEARERAARERAAGERAARELASMHEVRGPAPQKYQEARRIHIESAQYTREVLSKKPTDAADPCVLPHILKAMAGDRPVSFSRGRSGRSHEQLMAMMSEDSATANGQWHMTLRSLPSWSRAASAEEVFAGGKAREDFEAEARLRIAESLRIHESLVQILGVKKGSVKVLFEIYKSGLSAQEQQRLVEEDVETCLRDKFDNMTGLETTQATVALHFDLDDFDPRGNVTNFADETHEVGPVGAKRPYHRPAGWVRYGLQVLGKYGDDDWLAPFSRSNDQLWYRAFHGTGRSQESAKAAKSIVKEGFRPSTRGKGGAGIYVSPFASYAEGYSGSVTVGNKKFKFILQVCVKPFCIEKELVPKGAENQEWVCRKNSVRPYGVLIKASN